MQKQKLKHFFWTEPHQISVYTFLGEFLGELFQNKPAQAKEHTLI